MVLWNLALSTRRLIRRIRRGIVVVCARRQVPSKIPIGVGMDNDLLSVESPGSDFDSASRASDLGSAVRATALRSGVGMSGVERGECTTERGGGGGGFMSAARMAPSGIQQQAQGQVSRSASSKRKLEELESGVAESSASSNSSQVRARREPRDDLADGSSIAESSGRERYDGGTCAPGEAQALDGESQMRDEIGNEAIDADAMCEDELVWNKSSVTDVASKSVPEGEESADASAEPGMIISEGRSNLASSAYASTQVESTGGAGIVSPASNGLTLLTNVLAGSSGVEFLASSEIGNIVRGSSSAEEEEDGLNEDELCREIEVDGIRPRERGVGNFSLCNIGDDELNNSHASLRYLNSVVTVAVGGGLDGCGYESGVSGEAAAASETLNGFVSSAGSGVDAQCGGSIERPPVDTGTPSRLQFFVRTYIDGRTVVLHGNASDSIETVHQQIFLKTGLPVSEQRLIFGGRQLQHEQTLESCRIGNDATLNLVARMRSTALPTSWQLVNDMVATIRALCVASPDQHVKLMHLQDVVRHSIQEFLKMATKPVPVSEHIRVFQLAGATSALVMLLLSKEESNRECAEESITQFLQANDDYLPAHIHCHCAPVLLDFCKLLSKSEPYHSLYSSCRNALARLLDTVGVAHGTPYFYEAKADSIVDDFAPFVEELSKHLCEQFRGISHTLLSREGIYPYARESKDLKEAKDFTAFVMPLCKAMEACKVADGSATLERTENEADGTLSLAMTDATDCVENWSSLGNPAYVTGRVHCAGREENYLNFFPSTTKIGTHGWLHQLFLELLEVMDAGLAAVSSMADRPQESRSLIAQLTDDRERVPCWAPFLIVLKGMHAVAKLYSGAMTDLLRVLLKRRKALNFLVRQSRWQDDDFWLLEHVDLLDFESKRRLVLAMLPEPQDDHDERHEIVVHRAQLLSASFEMLAYVEPDGLQGGISVEFATEEATGPGVLREWFSMICREIFNCQNALFLPCPNDRRRFFPNPASGVNPGHLTYFRFCGRVIALALMHRVQIDVVFAAIFFKQLAGLPVSWEDAKDADPVLYESCKKILEMDAEIIDSDALGLTFVSEVEELGTRKTLELCHGGREIVVNSGNRRQFVELLIQRRLVASVADQIKSFSQGFSDLLVNASHQQFLRALQLEELDLLLYGQDRNICLEDWKRHTEYHDYSSGDLEIVWFWQVLEGMTMEQRRSLLFFSTSVKHLPAEGFAGLSSKFHIHRGHTDISWLPTAHTCFYQLILPAYPTYDIMHTRLRAISEAHVAEGFGFA